MFGKLRQRIRNARWEDATHPSRGVRFLRSQLRLHFYTLREVGRNRCPQQAAALTFTTLLSLVPLFAVAFSLFRSFVSFQGIENRAQNAVFRAILAGPLLETRAAYEREEETSAAAERIAQTAPGQALPEADSQSRFSRVGVTFRLYVRALEGGTGAAQARAGMSTLQLSAIGPLQPAFSLIAGGAREAYLRAAGIAEASAGAAQAHKGEVDREYENALRDLGKANYPDALKALAVAERAGHSPFATREAAARAEEGLADGLAGLGRHGEAAEHYRAALADYTDAIVLAGGTADEATLSALAARHDEALSKLGHAVLQRGVMEAALYNKLRGQGGPEAEQAFDAAQKSLTEAAALLEHPGEAHVQSAELHAAAGRQQQALEEYRLAVARGQRAAARDIGVAVVDYLRMLVDKLGRAEIGVVGSLLLLVTAVVLLSTIEKTLNQIWEVTQHRPFWIKFTSFCTLLWLGPALIGASIWVRERLGDYIGARLLGMAGIGWLLRILTAGGEYLLPFLATWLVLVALYKYLPHTQVRFKSAAWGALLAAILLQGARPLFTLYVLKVLRYERIYGSLGAIPIFLIWVWLLWLIVLFGAEASFTIQNMGLLVYRDKLHRLSSIFIDRSLAARIMMYVAREFRQAGRPATVARLGESLQTTPEAAADAAGRLVKLGLLTPLGEEGDQFLPARDPARIKLSEILSVADRFRDESRPPRAEDKRYEARLEDAFQSVIRAQDQALHSMTLSDLLEECEEEGRKTPASGREKK